MLRFVSLFAVLVRWRVAWPAGPGGEAARCRDGASGRLRQASCRCATQPAGLGHPPVRWMFAVLVGCLSTSHANAADPPPNFVLINIDDLGYADIAPFGSTINRTPHLDRLAAEGRKLTCFYGAPVCSPSRSSLMTGCYPKRVGVPKVLFPGQATGLNASEHTLPELLKEQGYATACIGKWHLGDQPPFLPTRHGFDEYYGIPYSNDMGPVADGARSDFGAALPKNVKTNHPPLPMLRNETFVKVVKAVDQTQLVQRIHSRGDAVPEQSQRRAVLSVRASLGGSLSALSRRRLSRQEPARPVQRLGGRSRLERRPDSGHARPSEAR